MEIEKVDEKYMRRCLQLARNAAATAAPNPMVGAVIVCRGRIIGEGFHIRCGGPHAEVNAIRSVKQPALLRESTIYVSLEPCAHYGKTPPCAELIIRKQIPRVVIGCRDPFARVDGRGIRMLREAGCEVVVGCLEEECRALIRKFVTFHSLQRPFVTLKWAESADKYIDVRRTGGSPRVLSTPLTTMLVHKRRSECGAIMVGRGTALLDNPSLTTRWWWGNSPLRVVLTSEGSLPPDLRLLDGEVPTVVFGRGASPYGASVDYVELSAGESPLRQVLGEIFRRGVQSLLVEGGSRLLQSFIAEELWDEAVVEETGILLGDGVASPVMPPHAVCRLERHFGHFYRVYEA